MTNELAGRVALITGASKGIGAGIATAFGHAGANVAVGYARDQHAAQRVAADIEALITKTVATFAPLDTLVNNAGVFDYKALADIDETHFHHIYDSNVLGLLTTTRFAVANFNHTGASVINISSLSAIGNATGRAVYA
jgi:3-oxoacyl-[acyl-carrier protein] reductase